MRIAVLALACLALPALADPVPFTESVTVEGRRFPIPMTVDMRTLSETELALTVSGDLGILQANLPALLSQVFEDGCEGRSAIAVTDVTASGRDIRILGQLQVRRHLCVGGGRGPELLRQTADVEVVLSGRLIGGCLAMEVRRATLRPDGFTGAILDATGATERITRDLQADLDSALREGDNCIEIPDEFRTFDTQVTGGGFREIGDGRLGAVIHGRMTVSAKNFVRLIELLGREGRLGE